MSYHRDYTVVGFYTDTLQRFLTYIDHADTPEDAEAKALAEADDGVRIVAVFDGTFDPAN